MSKSKDERDFCVQTRMNTTKQNGRVLDSFYFWSTVGYAFFNERELVELAWLFHEEKMEKKRG